MIEQFRYFLNGSRVHVRWNYVDVEGNSVKAICALKKRINDEVIDERIVSMDMWQRCGGCDFDLPDCPAMICVTEENKERNAPRPLCIKESPKYKLSYSVKIENRKDGADSIQTVQFSMSFPNNISDNDIHAIPSWMIHGLYKNTETFFFAKPFERKNVTGEMELPEKMKKPKEKDFSFAVADGIADERYKNVFTFENVTETREEPSAGFESKTIELIKIKSRNSRKYYPIRCPFCLKEFEPNAPVFRAKVYDNEAVGFRAEYDEVYHSFIDTEYKLSVDTNRQHDTGRVLTWANNGNIKAYTTEDGKTHDYDPADGVDSVEGIVVSVVDMHDNKTTEKICPYCHYPLPTYIGLYPMVFINMMGYTGTGKTVYLSRIAKMLQEGRLLSGYKLHCDINKNETSHRFIEQFERICGFTHESVSENDLDDGFAINDGSFSSEAFEGGMTFDDNANMQEGQNLGWNQVSFDESYDDSNSTAFISETETAPEEDTDSKSRRSLEMFIDNDGSDGTADETNGDNTQDSQEEQYIFDEYDSFGSFDGDSDADADRQQMPAATSIAFHEPCVYQLTNEENEGIIMCLFDFPGECIKADDNRQSYHKYYEKLLDVMDGMVFLIDPMSIDKVRKMDPDKKEEFSKETSSIIREGQKVGTGANQMTINQVLKDFKNTFSIDTKISKPVVFAISKADAIRDKQMLIDPTANQNVLLFLEETSAQMDEERKAIEVGEIMARSKEIVDYMDDKSAEQECGLTAKDYVWMCVSALGIAPKDGSMKGRYGNPMRALSPLEWILYKLQEANH